MTSQVEKLPDIVPDQSRLIEDETTEVGAVCVFISGFTIYYVTFMFTVFFFFLVLCVCHFLNKNNKLQPF